MVGFFKLMSESWKGFRNNFAAILFLFTLLSAVPSLILGYIGIPMLSTGTAFYSTNQGILYLVLSFLFMFLTMLLSSSILVMAFSSKRLSFKQAISSGSKYWISFVFLYILLMVITFALSLPSLIAVYFSMATVNVYLLILGALLLLLPLYFIIKLAFSPSILIAENKSVLSSLTRSFEITKRKFWKIFLFLILLLIIIFILHEIIGGIGYLINSYTGNASLVTDSTTNIQSVKFTTAGFFIQQIFSLVSSLITTPFFLFFLKNFYSALVEKKN